VSASLYLAVASVEARRRLSYRLDFWIGSVVGVLVHFAVAWLVWVAIFEASGRERVAEWDLGGMAAYYAAVLLASRLVRGGEFEGQISTDVYEGQINRYLVLPAPYAGLKYAQHLGGLFPVVLQAVALGAVAVALVPASPEVEVTLGGAARALVSLALASVLYFLLNFPLQAVSFWADNVWSLSVLLRFVTDLLGGAMVPLTAFPGWAQDAGRWLPFHCLFAAPVEALLGRMDTARWLESLAVGGAWCVVLALVGRGVWRRGTRQYSGVGM
jgi:ABC-2 type transport system permease protein